MTSTALKVRNIFTSSTTAISPQSCSGIFIAQISSRRRALESHLARTLIGLVASWKRMQDPSKTVPPHAKVDYDAYVASQHRKDSLLMFNRLLESCFDSCVEKFHSKNLAEKEKDCIRNCADRHMKTTQRVGFRYSELNFLKVRSNPAPFLCPRCPPTHRSNQRMTLPY